MQRLNKVLNHVFHQKQDLTHLQANVDKAWEKTNTLFNDMQIEKIQPLLQLYSEKNSSTIKNIEEQLRKINEMRRTIQRHLFQADEIQNAAILKKDILVQKKLLKILHYYCQTILYRQKNNYHQSLEAVNLFITETNKLIASKRLNMKAVLVNAYNQQAKIYRALAGKDYESLDEIYLLLAKNSYEIALKLDENNPIILNCLGFLLIDSAIREPNLSVKETYFVSAFSYQRKALALDDQDPNIYHGLGHTIFNFQIHINNLYQIIDTNQLEEALDYYSFVEKRNPNARLFLDRALVFKLLGKENEALNDLNKGLHLDPHHLLLRLERGNLYLKQADLYAALEDFQRGRLLSIDTPSFKNKFNITLNQVRIKINALAIQQQKYNSMWARPSPIKQNIEELDIRTIAKKATLKTTIRNCADYAKILRGISTQKPTVFISYAWGNTAHEKRVERMAETLDLAGFNVLFDHWHDKGGRYIMDFINRIKLADYILVIGSHLYLEKVNTKALTKEQREPMVAAEMRCIEEIIGYNKAASERVIPILFEGTGKTSLPISLHGKIAIDLTDEIISPISILNLIRDMHGIPNRDDYYKQIKKKYELECRKIDTTSPKILAEEFDKEINQEIISQPTASHMRSRI